MKEIINIIKREIRKVYTDSNLLMIFLVAPIAYPLLYGAIYLDKVEENVPIGVCDYDNSNLSRDLIRQIDAHPNISVLMTVANESEAMQLIANETVHSVLMIPPNFSKDLKYGKQQHLQLLMSPGRLLVLSDIGLPISQIVSTFGGKVTASALMKKGVPVLQDAGYAQPIKMNFHYLNNPYLTYGDLILPALMIIILAQIIFIGVSAAQAKEWLLDKWRDQMKTSNDVFYITIGKIAAYTLIFSIFALISFGIIAPFYEVVYYGKFLDTMIIAFFGIISSVAFGLFIGSYFRHRVTVFVVLGFSTYPFFMISGYAWPAMQLPYMLELMSYLLPMTPFLQASMTVSQMQNEISAAAPYLFVSFLQMLLYGLLFALRLRRIKNRREPKTEIEKYIAGFPR